MGNNCKHLEASFLAAEVISLVKVAKEALCNITNRKHC